MNLQPKGQITFVKCEDALYARKLASFRIQKISENCIEEYNDDDESDDGDDSDDDEVEVPDEL